MLPRFRKYAEKEQVFQGNLPLEGFRGRCTEGRHYDTQLHRRSAQSRVQAQWPRTHTAGAPGCPTVSTHACHSAATPAQSRKLSAASCPRPATSSRLKGLDSSPVTLLGAPGADRDGTLLSQPPSHFTDGSNTH